MKRRGNSQRHRRLGRPPSGGAAQGPHCNRLGRTPTGWAAPVPTGWAAPNRLASVAGGAS